MSRHELIFKIFWLFAQYHMPSTDIWRLKPFQLLFFFFFFLLVSIYKPFVVTIIDNTSVNIVVLMRRSQDRRLKFGPFGGRAQQPRPKNAANGVSSLRDIVTVSITLEPRTATDVRAGRHVRARLVRRRRQ